VHIYCPATACTVQSLLTFWSHTEHTWMFAQIAAALQIITLIVLQLYSPMISLKGIVA